MQNIAYCHAVWPVGSRATCDPKPMDTDADFLAFAWDRDAAIKTLTESGFLLESRNYGNTPFLSLRRSDTNIILSDDGEFIDKFLLASCIAKKLNLLRKEDRITLFDAIMHGNGRDVRILTHD